MNVTNTKSKVLRIIGIVFIFLMALIALFPLYWMFVTAVKPQDEIFNFPPTIWPSRLVWSNFAGAMERANFLKYFRNSLITTVSSVTITIFINLLAGFAFAKYRFKGKEIMFTIVLSTLMIPMQVIMIPVFMIAAKIGIRNTLLGVIIPPCAEAFGLFMARQFISEIPDELLEAARIDGATEFNIFWRVIVPNVKPLTSTLIIFTVMWRWNDLQWPLIMLSSERLYTIQLGLSTLNGALYVNWNDIMAASLIAIMPVVIVFLIFQRQFVEGMVASGIKG